MCCARREVCSVFIFRNTVPTGIKRGIFIIVVGIKRGISPKGELYYCFL
jgi:hypothetical protein